MKYHKLQKLIQYLLDGHEVDISDNSYRYFDKGDQFQDSDGQWYQALTGGVFYKVVVTTSKDPNYVGWRWVMYTSDFNGIKQLSETMSDDEFAIMSANYVLTDINRRNRQ